MQIFPKYIIVFFHSLQSYVLLQMFLHWWLNRSYVPFDIGAWWWGWIYFYLQWQLEHEIVNNVVLLIYTDFLKKKKKFLFYNCTRLVLVLSRCWQSTLYESITYFRGVGHLSDIGCWSWWKAVKWEQNNNWNIISDMGVEVLITEIFKRPQLFGLYDLSRRVRFS